MSEEMKQQTPVALWKIQCMRIRDFFVASGDKQEVFAKRIGVSQPTLSQWVNLRNAPRTDQVEAVAKAVGVPAKCTVCRDDDTTCVTCTPKRCPPRQHPSA